MVNKYWCSFLDRKQWVLTSAFFALHLIKILLGATGYMHLFWVHMKMIRAPFMRSFFLIEHGRICPGVLISIMEHLSWDPSSMKKIEALVLRSSLHAHVSCDCCKSLSFLNWWLRIHSLLYDTCSRIFWMILHLWCLTKLLMSVCICVVCWTNCSQLLTVMFTLAKRIKLLQSRMFGNGTVATGWPAFFVQGFKTG